MHAYTRLLTHLIKHYPDEVVCIPPGTALGSDDGCTVLILKRSFVMRHAFFIFEDEAIGWNRFTRWAEQTGILVKDGNGLRMRDYFWMTACPPDNEFVEVCDETGYVFRIPESDPTRWPALFAAMHEHRDVLAALEHRGLDGFSACVHIDDIEAQPLPELDICFA